MITKALICFAAIGLATCAFAQFPEIRGEPITGWFCLDYPYGYASPEDEARNAMKNRPPVDLSSATIESLDTAGFLKKVAAYDAELHARRRTKLTPAATRLLESYEKQLVSLTGYLVVAYPEKKEQCNCDDSKRHDWHLELSENPADPVPGDNDSPPIICEITPRTEQPIYESGVRLRSLAGWFRTGRHYTSTGHPPQLVKITGFLLWDDRHHGSAGKGRRSTAWEIHPVISIEELPSSTVLPSTGAESSPEPEMVTITVETKIQTPNGEAVLPRGLPVEVVSATPTTVTIRYLGGVYPIPISSTDRAQP